MGSAVVQVGRFAESQESRFQAAERSDMSRTIVQGGHLLMIRNRIISLPNVQICVVPSCRGEELLNRRITFSGRQTFRYEQCRSVRGSICLCLGIEFSGYETFRYVQWRRAGWLIPQESRFQPNKRSDISRFIVQWGNLMMLKNRALRLPNAQIWAEASCG